MVRRCLSLLVKLHLSVLGAAFLLVLFATPRIVSAKNSPLTPQTPSGASIPGGLIQHIVIIMQENRTFDHYFGTYPGVKGIPRDAHGVPTVCVPDPLTGVCMRPYHSPTLVNYGGPHGNTDSVADIDNGKMDGFVAQAEIGNRNCVNSIAPECSGAGLDVMGYHTQRELPNYWTYAKNFVLQDNLYEPVGSYSLPAHLFMVSGWSAQCKSSDPMTCGSNIAGPPFNSAGQFAWTDITYLLHKNGISWKYYIEAGLEPDCEAGEMECAPGIQGSTMWGYWNPLPRFATVQEDNELGNVVPFDQFFLDAENGTLPQVSWIIPANGNSEHPPSTLRDGQAYVTGLINAVMTSPNWPTTALFLSWDDWGGFYDHANPPSVDVNGYGIRVPGLVISPYAKRGFVDHQVLSHDAYLKFIEDVFLSSRRLDPSTDERPDTRPAVRENAAVLGDLANDFDFTQSPHTPLLLYQYFNYSSFAYVANGASNDISAFAIDWHTGRLSPVSGSPFATAGLNPISAAHDPQSRFLFGANNGSNTISAYIVNQSTGALTPVPGSPFPTGDHPVELLVDATGGYLFSLNSGSVDLWTYSIHPSTGVLTLLSSTSLHAAASPSRLAMESSGRFLYAASSATQQIFGFIFNNSNGKLSPMSGSPFSTGVSGGPTGLAIDREARWLFSSNGNTNSIGEFQIQYTVGNAGALTPTQASISCQQSPAAISVFESDLSAYGNEYVLAVNSASNNLSGYIVTGTGTASPMTNSPYAAGTNPVALAKDQLDGYVYAASAEGIWAFKMGQTALFPVKGSPFPDANMPQAIEIISTIPVPQYALATNTTISSSVNPSVYGQPVTFTAAVTAVSGPPIGGAAEIMSFSLGDATVLGTGTISNGSAHLTTSTLLPGAKPIKAIYSGDAHLPASASSGISQVINRAPTTITLTTSANPSTFGKTVTFTAKMSVPYGVPPAGSLNFNDGTTKLGYASLISGTAVFSTAKLSSGSHSITATYAGSAYYLPGTSGTIVQNVR